MKQFKQIVLLGILSIALAAVSTTGSAVPKPGFVNVIGSAVPGMSHADRGAPVQMQSLALKDSGAEIGYCNQLDSRVIDPLLASGRDIATYVNRNTSLSTGQWLYSNGIHLFIFENEPDGNLADYASVLPMAYPIIHSLGPLSRMISGNCFGSDCYSYLYQNGFKNYSDMVGFHDYSDDPATGLDIGSVISVHNTMNAYSDGSKPIFLGEGWGPKRELRTCPRISPDVPLTVTEIGLMRSFVVNGWHNLTTAQGGYDPSWVYAALFFTLSDNWGFDYAHFYNGGLIDIYGNPKDDLLLLFPGNKLTVSNCGFEYFNAGKPVGAAPFWTPRSGTSDSCYGVDTGIRRAGIRSQRIELSGTVDAYVTQTSANSSVVPGQSYTFAAWVKTQSVDPGAYVGARLWMVFRTSTGAQTGSITASSGLSGDTDWRQVTVTASAPSNAAKVSIYCDLQGVSGRAWFDDCSISAGSSVQKGAVEGCVFDTGNHTLAGANVTVQPAGLTAVTDSSGAFSITGVPAGACDVIATKSGYGAKTVSRVVVAPGRTSIAGLTLQTVTADAPANVQVSSTGVSRVLRISWEPAPSGADCYRVYRSMSSGSLGARVFDNVTDLTVWDEGLSDYQTYYYTVRRVLNGVESTNTDRHTGTPTGGATGIIYDNSASPDWSNWATEHGQTFIATKTGGIVSATCVLATAGEPRNRNITFSIRDGGPTGPQIGPSRTVTCYSDEIGTASWSADDVPVVAGRTYYLRLVASSGTAIYRTESDTYPGGCYYKDGQPYSPSVDMWSTITVAEGTAPDVLNVSAVSTGAGEMRITWDTTAPTTSQVYYGATTAYGLESALDPSVKAHHEVTLTGLTVGSSYHFRVNGTRPALPDAYSLDYTFTVPEDCASVSLVRSQRDGLFLGFAAVVSAIFSDHFYAQDTGRTAGIRVRASGDGIKEGDRVYISGSLKTDAAGERYVDEVTVARL